MQENPKLQSNSNTDLYIFVVFIVGTILAKLNIQINKTDFCQRWATEKPSWITAMVNLISDKYIMYHLDHPDILYAQKWYYLRKCRLRRWRQQPSHAVALANPDATGLQSLEIQGLGPLRKAVGYPPYSSGFC